MYGNQSTSFFCDVAQYRVWKYEQGIKDVSWNSYRCTLFQFYDFLVPKLSAKKNYERIGKRIYENLCMEEFDMFLTAMRIGEVGADLVFVTSMVIYWKGTDDIVCEDILRK